MAQRLPKLAGTHGGAATCFALCVRPIAPLAPCAASIGMASTSSAEQSAEEYDLTQTNSKFLDRASASPRSPSLHRSRSRPVPASAR